MAITVIVADDESIIRMDIVEELKEAGFAVVAEAIDGFDAVECCREHHPDVALIDINMPVIDGISVARMILSEKLVQAVVLITAYNDEKYIQEAGNIGVGGYIVKPIRENSIIPAIHIALAQSRHLRHANDTAKQAQQQSQERRTIDRAKSVLAKKLGCSEAEALSRMQQDCMRRGCQLIAYAATILEADTESNVVQRAKRLLMDTAHLSESAAFNRIRAMSRNSGISLPEAARRMLLYMQDNR